MQENVENTSSRPSGYSDDLYHYVEAYISPVTSAYISIAERNAFYRIKPVCKNNDAANNLLDAAFNMTLVNKYLTAFRLYARSLMKAGEDAELLAQIFYSRAATLEKINYYTESMKDNQRASRNGNLSPSLRHLIDDLDLKLRYEQRGSPNYLKQLRPHIAEDYSRNSEHNIAKEMHLLKDGFIATSSIPTGACLIAEGASGIAPLKNHSLFCYGCMNFSLTPIPCPGCTTALFCSETCRGHNWAEYHQYECKIMPALKKIKYRLAVRIALSLHDIIDMNNDFDVDEIYVDHDYIDALHSTTRGPNIPLTTANELAFCAAQVFHLVKEYTIFFDDIKHTRKYDTFKGILLKLMYVDETIGFRRTQTYLIGSDSVLTTSFSAYYPFTSRLRYSCAPNASQICHDDASEVRALRDIEPGEEVTIASENYHYTLTERSERQRIFKNRYFSECLCQACNGNWPLFIDLVYKHNPDLLHNIKKVRKTFERYPSDPEAMHLCFKNLILLSMERNWNTPSIEWALFESAFRLSHSLTWRSLHCLTQFVNQFPDSSQD